MGYDYTDFPYCRDCKLTVSQDEKIECAVYWRPQTGTKTGFPTEDGWNCPKDTFNRNTVGEILQFNRRALILLKAASDILEKLDETPYVLNFFEQTAVWDEVECDGYCLMEEINDLLEEVGYANER